MATSRADFQTEDKQNCPICLGDFKIPRQLPCMHSFCEKCLQDYISFQDEKEKKLEQIKCPICRQDVSNSQEGKSGLNVASLFPINVILQSIVSDAKQKVDHSCDSCHSTGISRPAQGVCVQCEETMCEHCSEVHQKQKISRNHVIISMQEFTSNPQNVMKLAKGFKCPEHDGETIDFYCKDHHTACCGKCCIISHRNCSQVSDLKKELPSLQQEKNPDNIIDEMRILESHMKKCKEINKSNINILESQVNGLTVQIRELRKKLNDELDELERRVTIEGNIIYKEEMKKKKEERNRFQSLINSIRNSCIILETVKKYGTATQVFVMTEKMTSQLTSYMDQIQEKSIKMETTTVLLEVNPKVKSIISSCTDSLATIMCSTETQYLTVPVFRKSSRDCQVQMNKVIEIKGNDNPLPDYVGVTYLYSGHVMLADFNNNSVFLVDSSYNLITSYKLPHYPAHICVVNDNDDVAVTMAIRKTVQLLSVKNGKITPTMEIPIRYNCKGVAAARNGKIIVSGSCDYSHEYYWSLISSGGKEESCHMFECNSNDSWTYVAVDSSFTHVYITINNDNSLYCFDMGGSQKFVYRNENLKNPFGVATDKYDNVYIVGNQSSNIHQLKPDGVVLQIISDGIPASPQAICFSNDGEKILVTNLSDCRKIYQYQLK